MADLTVGQIYDLVPYLNQAYAQSHPDRLATVALLFGLKPQRVDRCRVLELGCAAGGNLIPLALQYPDSEFVGVELSPRQVEDGRQAIAATGLKNVELRAASILDMDASYGEFDYIISHGVYSWIPEEVRDKHLDIYRQNLTPDGIGYISFNTLPGWHMRGMIRDMMRYHVGRLDNPTPQNQVARARALLDFLARSVQGDNNPYPILLRQELDTLSKKSDAYFYHEQLEPHNDAFYFFQFCQQLAGKGLRYLGESSVNSMGTFGFPDTVRQGLSQLAANQIDMEQYLDFLVNRTFRQTLVCHQENRPNYALTPERVLGFHVATPLRPKSPAPSLLPGVVEAFVGPEDARVESKDPIAKAALLCMSERWPQAVSFDELRRLARDRLTSGSADDPAWKQQDVVSLGNLLLQCYVSGANRLLELWHCQPRFAIDVSQRPTASALARWQATTPLESVTNMRHEMHRLSDLARLLLPLLDGSRDRTQVLHDLADLVVRKDLKVEVNGSPVTDAAEARQILDKPLDQELHRLARSALLVA